MLNVVNQHSPPLGIAAAKMFMPENVIELSDAQLRVVFDGDGVLFSDESEKITQTMGLDAFIENEKELENVHLTQVTDGFSTLTIHGPATY